MKFWMAVGPRCGQRRRQRRRQRPLLQEASLLLFVLIFTSIQRITYAAQQESLSTSQTSGSSPPERVPSAEVETARTSGQSAFPQAAVRAAPSGLSIGSPANLLSPDRYEFYTFDETGDLVRRRMTLDEIKSLLAGGDGDLGDNPIATFYHGPVVALGDSIPSVAARDPEDAFEDAVKGVQDVVNNVQNVLKTQLAASKNKLPSYIPAPRPPTHQMTWGMLLPSIMENAVSTSMPHFTTRPLLPKPTDSSEKPLRQSLRPTRPPSRPTENPVVRITEKSAVKPAERTTPRPVNRPTQPTAKPFTKTPEKHAAKPSVKPSQKPGVKPSGKPPNRQPGSSHPPHPVVTQVKENARPAIRPRPGSHRPPVTTTTPRTYTMPPVQHTTAGNPSEEMNKLSLLYTLVSSSPVGASILRNHSSSFVQSMMSPFPSRTTTLRPLEETTRPESAQNKEAIQEMSPLKPVALKSPPPEQMVKVPIIQRPHHPSTTVSYLGNTQSLGTDSATKSTESTIGTQSVVHREQFAQSTLPPRTTTEPPVFTTVFYVSGNKNHIEDPAEIKSSDIELGTSNYIAASSDFPTTNLPVSTVSPYQRPAIITKVTDNKKPLSSSTTASSWTTLKTEPTTELTETWATTATPPPTTQVLSQALSQALLTRVPASVFLQKLQLATTTESTTTEANNKTVTVLVTTQPTSETTPTESSTQIPTEPYTKTYLKISSVTSPKKEPVKVIPREKPPTTSPTSEASKVTLMSTPHEYSTIEPKIMTTTEELFETVSLFNPSGQPEVITASPEDVAPTDKPVNKSELESATRPDIQDNAIESRTESIVDLETESSPGPQEMISTELTTIDDDRTTVVTEALPTTVKNQNELLATTAPPPYTTMPPSSDHKGTIEAVTPQNKVEPVQTERPSSTAETSTLKAHNETPEQNWTRISVVDQKVPLASPSPPSPPSPPPPPPAPPQPEPGYHSPSSVELHAAPHENLGLETSTTAIDPDIHGFVNLCNELAFQMWNSVKDDNVSTSRSLVLSPFAATSQLAMVFLGARGPTSGQMNDVLRLDDMVSFNPHQVMKNITESILHAKNPGIATAAMVRELYSDKNKGKLLDFYKERAQQFYDGHVEEIAFRQSGDIVRRRTNILVKRQTHGRISEYMLGAMPLRPPLAAFSANILETDCVGASIEGRDGEMHFVVTPASRQRRLVPVPAAVWRSGFLAGYEPALDATAVALGSPDGALSTVLILPGQQGHVAPGDGILQLEQRLLEARAPSPGPAQRWGRLLRTLLPRPGLELQLPRFSHRSVVNMSSCLSRMGLGQLFNRHEADLRGLNGVANDLHLADVVQLNTFSTCGERSANSRHHVEYYPKLPNVVGVRHRRKVARYLADFEDPSILNVPLALRPRQARVPDAPRLRFDRPFLFFVRHNPTGMILHMGRFNPVLLP